MGYNDPILNKKYDWSTALRSAVKAALGSILPEKATLIFHSSGKLAGTVSLKFRAPHIFGLGYRNSSLTPEDRHNYLALMRTVVEHALRENGYPLARSVQVDFIAEGSWSRYTDHVLVRFEVYPQDRAIIDGGGLPDNDWGQTLRRDFVQQLTYYSIPLVNEKAMNTIARIRETLERREEVEIVITDAGATSLLDEANAIIARKRAEVEFKVQQGHLHLQQTQDGGWLARFETSGFGADSRTKSEYTCTSAREMARWIIGKVQGEGEMIDSYLNDKYIKLLEAAALED